MSNPATVGSTRTRQSANGHGEELRPLPRPRRGPNGRAALGALLVALAVVVLFSVAEDRGHPRLETYVAARHALAIGDRINARDLATASLHVPNGSLRGHVFQRADEVVGAVVIAPIGGGELLQASSLVRSLDRNERQVSVPIESARALGDSLAPGELVDVVATFGTGSDAFSVTVVSGARIVARQTTGGALTDHKTEVVTLGVTDAESAVALAHAVAAGEISFIRVTGVGASAAPPAIYRAPQPEKSR